MKLRVWSGVAFLSACVVATIAACIGDTATTDDGGVDAGDAGNDVGTPIDAAPDQVSTTDANDAAQPTVYSTFNDTSKWDTYELKNVIPGVNGFHGGAFDGRYIYLSPGNGTGIVARYDTTAPLGTLGSWQTFDVNAIDDAGYPTFSGAAFDGRYVYFVPATAGSQGNPSGVAVRFDTQGTFTSASAWSSFDIATVYNAGAAGFRSAVFDGQYLYFVPNMNKYNVFDGLLARYNTKSDFTDAAAAWQTEDFTYVSDAGAIDYYGGVYDGRYVYFVPTRTPGVVTRFDTQSPWTGTSFTMFNLATFTDAGAGGFIGGAFDGRYVYFSPNYSGGTSGLAARYDTQAPFNQPSSWVQFDMTLAHGGLQGFQGAAFDGRYVYYVPNQSNLGLSGLIGRYDTQQPFSAPGSWSTFDTMSLDDASPYSVAGFFGAIFDGRYLYFVPSNGSVIVRFDAKTPAALPPGFAHGSFY